MRYVYQGPSLDGGRAFKEAVVCCFFIRSTSRAGLVVAAMSIGECVANRYTIGYGLLDKVLDLLGSL